MQQSVHQKKSSEKYPLQFKICNSSVWPVAVVWLHFNLNMKTKPITAARKSISKVVKLKSLVSRKVVKRGKYIASRNLQILYAFLLRAKICTTFTPKVVRISTRNTKLYKICKFLKTIFFAFYNLLKPNFAVLLILRSSF